MIPVFTRHRGVTVIWTPAALFTGADGTWFDPSDLTTLFQDVAGTIPVTAAGQAVALMRDKSGNAHHASQVTGDAQPVLQQDGSGNYYLDFNGSRYMDCGTGFNATTFFAGVGYNGSAANQRVLDTRGTGLGGTVVGWYAKVSNPTGSDGIVVDDGSAIISSNSMVTLGSNHVGYFDHLVAANLRFRFESDTALSTVTGTALGSTTSAKVSRIGAASNDGSQGLIGRIYGVVVVKTAASTSDISHLRSWLGTKTGVTIG